MFLYKARMRSFGEATLYSPIKTNCPQKAKGCESTPWQRKPHCGMRSYMKKRILALTIVLVLSLSLLASCGGNADEDKNRDDGATAGKDPITNVNNDQDAEPSGTIDNEEVTLEDVFFDE